MTIQLLEDMEEQYWDLYDGIVEHNGSTFRDENRVLEKYALETGLRSLTQKEIGEVSDSFAN